MTVKFLSAWARNYVRKFEEFHFRLLILPNKEKPGNHQTPGFSELRGR